MANVDPGLKATYYLFALLVAAQSEPGETKLRSFPKSEVGRLIELAEHNGFRATARPEIMSGEVPIAVCWNKGDAT